MKAPSGTTTTPTTSSSAPDWGELREQARLAAEAEPPGSQLRAAAIKLVGEIEQRLDLPRTYTTRAERHAARRRGHSTEG